MKMLAVPVPLFNKDMVVEAYCFRFQKGDSLLNTNYSILDGAMDSPLLDVINEAGLEALTIGKPIFVPISHILLLTQIEEKCNEPAQKIAFVLGNETPVENTFIERIKRFKSMGYRFACHSKMNLVNQAPIISLCDFIFLNVKTDFNNSYSYIRKNYLNVSVIVSDIDTAQTFNSIKNAGFSFMEGSFYRLPLTKGQTKVSPLKINYIRLLNIVRDEDFEIERITAIVQQDTALAISLLRMVNSIGSHQKINSINHAAVMIGQQELRKWITTAVTKMLSADRPNEITKLSLIRAKFAENIAPKFELAIRAPELFLMGLFSALDLILGMTMEDALDNVFVSDVIRNALLYKKGPFYNVLSFILCYESADWISVSRDLIINRIDVESASKAYFDALTWYGELVKQSDQIDIENLDAIDNIDAQNNEEIKE